jgi:CO/xanthine dehydrogenase FAD-binding subunit
MKAVAFQYARPGTLAEACELLASDGDARVIAGGQTLVPMMAMRLARPSLLVDISRLSELTGISELGASVVVGAVTRQAVAECDALVRRKAPLLARALPFVGHAPTRNRGTLGGSVANADPAAEIPLVLATLSGSILLRTTGGEHPCSTDAFFEGPMMTSAPEGGIVSRLIFPVWSHRRIGVGFEEISARQSDFAYVSAAAQVALDADGRCLQCAIGIGAATAVPSRLDDAMQALTGSMLTDAQIRDVLAPAVDALDIMTDAHASSSYRRRVALTLATRALTAAREEALAKGTRA